MKYLPGCFFESASIVPKVSMRTRFSSRPLPEVEGEAGHRKPHSKKNRMPNQGQFFLKKPRLTGDLSPPKADARAKADAGNLNGIIATVERNPSGEATSDKDFSAAFTSSGIPSSTLPAAGEHPHSCFISVARSGGSRSLRARDFCGSATILSTSPGAHADIMAIFRPERRVGSSRRAGCPRHRRRWKRRPALSKTSTACGGNILDRSASEAPAERRGLVYLAGQEQAEELAALSGEKFVVIRVEDQTVRAWRHTARHPAADWAEPHLGDLQGGYIFKAILAARSRRYPLTRRNAQAPGATP